MAKRKLTARQVRYLWAIGAFRRKAGTKRGVVYDRAAAQRARPVIGGSKAAPLRSGAAPARRIPSKAERDATRASRIEAGRNHLLKRGILKDLEMVSLFGSTSGPRPNFRGRSDDVADRARGVARAARARARYINQAAKARKAAESSPFAATREARVAKGREVATRFLLRLAGGVASQQRAAALKPMSSRYPGRFLDSGKPFQAGARIYYGDGRSGKGAYSRQPRFENLKHLPHGGFGGKLTLAQRVAALTLQEGVKAGFKGKKLKDKMFGVTRTRFRQERVRAAKFMQPFTPRK